MNGFLLYIDPGTGSMIFSLFMALATTTVFVGRELFIRFKFVLSGGRARKADSKRIPYVIYSDHKRYWNVFKPVCDEFERRCMDVVYYTQSPDDPVLTEPYQHVKAEFIGEGNKGFARLNFLKADIVLSSTPGLEVYQWKRSRDVKYYVHIYHSVSEGTGYRMFGLCWYDAVLVGGPITAQYIKKLDDLRGLPPKEIMVTGITYMDTLKEKFDSLRNDVFSKDNDGRRCVLLAPSWGSSSILSKYGDRIISALLATGNKIIVRPHPQSLKSEKELIDTLMEKFPEGDNISWNFDNDNFSSLNESDILISDFSGVIYDYALVFGRPVIYAEAVLDSSPYDAAWFDEERWTVRMLPSLGYPLHESDFPHLATLIEKAITDDRLALSRKSLAEKCWVNVGKAASCTTDFLIEKHAELAQNNVARCGKTCLM